MRAGWADLTFPYDHMTPVARKRLFWIGGAIALALAAFLLWPSGGDEAAGPGARPRSDTLLVTFAAVQEERLEDQFATTGTLLPWEAVELRAEVSGRITALRFEEGSRVQQGQTLALIDTRVLEAERAAAQTRRDLAALQAQRQRELFEIGGLSRQALDQAESAARVLDAELDRYAAEIARRRIVAPFSGEVGLREVSVGAYVSPGDRIATLRVTQPLKLEFTVPERYLGRVRPGDAVEFTVPGRDESFTASVYAVEPAVDVSTRAFAVRARTGNADGALTPGAFAEVALVFNSIADALLVPTVAVVPGADSASVFVVRSGKAMPRRIGTGVRTADRIQVTSGLAAGDTVLTSGFEEVRPGQPVRAAATGFDPAAPAPAANASAGTVRRSNFAE